jgi:hypothetical protein
MIETHEQYERLNEKHLVLLDSKGYGNKMLYATDVYETIEALREVAKAARGEQWGEQYGGYILVTGEAIPDSLLRRTPLTDALAALPEWIFGGK